MLSLAFHTTHVQADPIPPPAGMVGWWPGDGDANDIVNNNNGVLLEGAVFDVDLVDQAFKLDGYLGCVRISDVPITGVGHVNLDGFSQLTIDAWIYPVDIPGPGESAVIVSKYDSRSFTGISYYLDVYDMGRLRMGVFYFIGYTDDFAIVTTNSMVINDHVWTHVACVWNGGSSIFDFELYMNGTKIEQVEYDIRGSFQTMADNDVPVNIGRVESYSGTYEGPGAYFYGRIDEVEIFDRALTQNEIQGIYNAGSDGKIKGPPGGIPLFSDILAILPLGIVTGAVIIRRRHKASK